MLRFIFILFFLALSAQFQAQIVGFQSVNDYQEPLKPIDMDGDGDIDLGGLSIWLENASADGRYYRMHPVPKFPINTNGNFDVCDLDGDGDGDIIVDGYVAVNQTGSFEIDSIAHPSGFNGYYPMAKDIDGDGLPELLKLGGTFIRWRKNLGGLDFAITPQSISFNMPTDSLYLEDMNGDGLTDLVGTGQATYLVMNNGAGNFQTPIQIDGTTTNYAAFFDYQIDGDLDIITAKGSQLKLLVNNGMGSFTPNPLPAMPGAISAVAVADSDLNGTFEVFVATNNPGETIQTFSGDAQGNFTSPADISLGLLLYDHYNGFFAKDMNNDGLSDAVFVPFYYGEISLLINEGNSVFQNQALTTHLAYSTPVIWTDIDADGDNDLVGTLEYSGLSGTLFKAAYWENNGEEAFRCHVVGDSVRVLATADLDGDVDADFIAIKGYINNETIVWRRNEGGGVFSPSIPLYDTEAEVMVVDMDNDNDIDVLVKNTFLYYLKFRWLENDGSGSFTLHTYPTAFDSYNEVIFEKTLLDMDGDGDEDMVVCTESRVDWKERLPDGKLAYQKLLFPGGEDYYAKHDWADLDGDLLPDFLMGDDQGITWRRNLGGGMFSIQQLISEQVGNFGGMDAGDIDLDGDNDIVFHIASGNSSRPKYLINFGNGQFSQPISIYGLLNFKAGAEQLSKSVSLLDIDNDGDLDLLNHGKAWAKNFANDPSTINLQCFFDENEDGYHNPGEAPLFGRKVFHLPSGNTYFSEKGGGIHLQGETGTNSLTAQPDELWQPTGNASINLDLPQPSASYHKFGFRPVVDTLLVYMSFNHAPMRCNEVVPFWLTIENSGTLPATGKVAIEHSPLAAYLQAFPAPDSIVGNVMHFSLQDLPPSGIKPILLKLQMPNESFVGELIDIEATMNIIGGNTQDTQMITASKPLACAVDPNDKLVLPTGLGEQGILAEAPESIIYTIRFQNTGTDTAQHVVLRDQLHPLLDYTSLRPLAGSHPYALQISSDGKMQVRFDHILLPDSSANEPASHGFFSYFMQPKSGLPIGSTVTNKAEIYFDFNAPILTNEVSNILGYELSVSLADNDSLLPFGQNLLLEPTIVNSFDTLAYEWRRNDTLVATSQSLLVTVPGIYKLTASVYGLSVQDSIRVLQLPSNTKESSSLFGFMAIVPNPAFGEADLVVQLRKPTDLHGRLYDARGLLVQKFNIDYFQTGTNKMPLPIGGLAAGYYMLYVQGADGEVKLLPMVIGN